MSNIKSEIGIVLVVAVAAIVFAALVASSVSPVQAQDGNSSSSANNTSTSPLSMQTSNTLAILSMVVFPFHLQENSQYLHVWMLD